MITVDESAQPGQIDGIEGDGLSRAPDEVALSELGDDLSSLRLCSPKLQLAMEQSLSRFGQLTPVQAFREGSRLEVFDGLKRLRAARQLSWSTLRVEVHELDSAGAKVRLLCCNAGSGLAELEEAWLVRSLYRGNRLTQPQIALLLSRHKSWVSRRLTLAEGLSDELTATVRLGLVSATAAVEIARLPRCNHDQVTGIVTRRGLTTRQTAHLVQGLLAAPAAQWPKLLEQASSPPKNKAPKTKAQRRTPAEQLVADAWGMKRLATRMHARLLERSLESFGEAACAVVSSEVVELHSALSALITTIDKRLKTKGADDAT